MGLLGVTNSELFRKLQSVERHLRTLIQLDDERIDLIMSLASDIKARLATLQQSAQANADATSAFAGVVDGLKAELANVQAALEDYKASHPDDTELTGIVEALDAIIANTDADTLAEKAVAGTPAA